MGRLSYRATTEFGALAGQLLADLERLRPGLPANASLEEIRRQCGERLRLRLPEIYREYLADASPSDEEAQLELYRREMEQLMLPRYAELAAKQNQSERKAGAGDVYNRVSYALLFFVIGVLVVWAPFIPLWDKWIPFALAIVAPLLAPWLPDLHRQLLQRRHEVAIGILQMDLDEAGRSLPLPPAALSATSTVSSSAAANPAAQSAQAAQARKQ